jgi:hypothetical protein
VEVIEGEEGESGDEEVDNGAGHADLPLVDDPDIAGDASGCVGQGVLLAVMLPYLRMGNCFMKLRQNISIIISQTPPTTTSILIRSGRITHPCFLGKGSRSDDLYLILHLTLAFLI